MSTSDAPPVPLLGGIGLAAVRGAEAAAVEELARFADQALRSARSPAAAPGASGGLPDAPSDGLPDAGSDEQLARLADQALASNPASPFPIPGVDAATSQESARLAEQAGRSTVVVPAPTSTGPFGPTSEPDWRAIGQLAGFADQSPRPGGAGAPAPVSPTFEVGPASLPDRGAIEQLARFADPASSPLAAPGPVPEPEVVPQPDPGRAADGDPNPPTSPVPMPDDEQWRTIPHTLAGVMGFVAQVPLVGDAPLWSDPTAPGVSDRNDRSLSHVSVGSDRNGGAVGAPAAAAAGGASDVGGPHPFDPNLARRDFPVLQQQVNGRPLVWLDNGATTQKPQEVIDRLAHFYAHEYSNIHRGAHRLAAGATEAYEGARRTVARFLGAGSEEEIVFVRGTTEGINLLAWSLGQRFLRSGDEVLITHLEHHANIVPWQLLCERTGAVLRVAPVDDTGQVLLSEYQRLVGPRTRIAAVTQVSNALGTITPVHDLVDIARKAGAITVVDGAQSAAHLPVDVQDLGSDFFVFSGHKVFAPTGIGVVQGRKELLDQLPPYQSGGNMIADVTFEQTRFQAAPARFEAGTPSIADAVGLGTALDYLTRQGREQVAAHEHALIGYADQELRTVPGLHIIGSAPKAGAISFTIAGHEDSDVGRALDADGIAVRAGHHCAQPILRRFGRETTVRPSFALYNTREDVDALVSTLHRLTTA